jgi:hypothetical protein
MSASPPRWLAVAAVALASCGGQDERPGERVPGGAGHDADRALTACGPSTRAFSPRSAWNRPLSRRVRPHPRSGALVRELRRQVEGSGAWINSYEYSAPVYRVPRRQRRLRVRLDTEYPQLERQFASVPVPRDAEPAAGSDAHMVVWQPARDTMWEFWKMRHAGDGWHARWGGRMRRVSCNRGAFKAPLGATATGLPLLGGLIGAGELRRGRIDHALAFALPEARSGVFAPPATRTDGLTADRRAIPLGTRFRLPPGLDLDRLGLTGPARVIAEAVQRYGMIARDKSGAVTFYAEAPTPRRRLDYGRLFGGRTAAELLQRFPWDRLRALDAPLRRSEGSG